MFILYKIDNISDTINSTAMKFGRKVVFEKSFKRVEVKMTLN